MELTSDDLMGLITTYANNMGEPPEVISMHPDVYDKFVQQMETGHVMAQGGQRVAAIALFYGIPILPKRKSQHDYVCAGRMCDLFPEC
jgi:hypothetical protein